MSMQRVIDGLIARGKLLHRPSSVLGISARDMYVTPDIHALAHPPFPDTELGERHAELSAFLDAFAELNEISVCQNWQRKPNDVMLARTNSPSLELWSLRITTPEETPGMRILGSFLALDSFVALTCDLRENIGGYFDDEVDAARQAWADHFGDVPPHTGVNLDDYLTHYYEV